MTVIRWRGAVSAVQELRGLLQRRPLQLLVLAGLLTAVAGACPALEVLRSRSGHLVASEGGRLDRRAPCGSSHRHPFAHCSRSAVGGLQLGLRGAALTRLCLVRTGGLGVFRTLLTLAVAYAVYWMARRLSGKFWVACVLATVTCSAFLFSLMPRPVFLSMMLVRGNAHADSGSRIAAAVRIFCTGCRWCFYVWANLPHSIYLWHLRSWAFHSECTCYSNWGRILASSRISRCHQDCPRAN